MQQREFLIYGVRKLRMWMPDRYFRRYVLCVGNPHGYRACKTFRIERLSDKRFGDVVPRRRHFASQGEGRYTATWYRVPEYGPATDRIGSRLGFHIR